MGHSKEFPPWWDHSYDDTGRLIRKDVRDAAAKVWGRVCQQVQRILGDIEDAGELLEKAVYAVSKYLNRHGAETQDPSGLLIVAVNRLAQRLRRQRGRVELLGENAEFDLLLHAHDWTEEVDRRLFIEKLVRCLRPETRGILRLRMEGFEWSEIARMLKMDAAKLRLSFWREVRNAHLKMLRGDIQGI